MTQSAQLTRERLERVIRLHQQAYDVLCWLSNIAFARPYLLTERAADELRDAARCAQWVRKHRHEFPGRLRPTDDTIDEFAQLFSSFFQTSFRIERMYSAGRPCHYRIYPKKDLAAGRDKLASRRRVPRATKRKRNEEARRLMARAMQAIDESVDVSQDAIATMYEDDELRQDLLLWAWAVELNDRAQGISHGPVVHVLWQQMAPNVRRHHTIGPVWAARENLVAVLASQKALH